MQNLLAEMRCPEPLDAVQPGIGIAAGRQTAACFGCQVPGRGQRPTTSTIALSGALQAAAPS